MQKFGRLVCAIAAVLPFFGVAETYTFAGKDAAGASAMNGSGSYGWTDSSGVTTKNHKPSAGNDYVVDQPYCLRTPTTTAFTFAGDSLTLTGGAEMKVKIGSDGTVTIPNLIVAGEARISHGDGNQIKKIAGAIDIREDGEAFFDLSFDNPDGNARQFEILSTISGNGILRAGASDPVKSGTPWIKFSGSLADFTGPIVIRANGSAKLETYFQSSLPGDPSEETADALSVEGESAALKFETSGKLGVTRGVSLGSGTCEIYVAAGQSVQIDGLLTGTAGFTKTGKGALALANVSPDLMGTVTVAEGVLQLCDASSRALPNATVSVASGALLDEHGPVCGSDLRVVATLADVRVAEDGQPHGPVLTVTEPKAGYQVTWSVDGGDYTTDYPAFISPCEHTIDCRVFADGYLMQSLRATVVIGICRRIVATEAEKVGDWANATVAGDDASAAIQGVINACGVGDLILVKAGTYLLSDALSFASSLPSGVMLRSDDGAGNLSPATTIFDGGSPAQTHRVFSIDAVNVTLKGITIRNGLQSGKDQNGGGVYVNANGFTVTNCIFDTCGAYNGGGLYWANKTVGGGILDCVFTNCTASNRGGGLYVCPEGFALRQTTVADCAATGEHGGGCFLERKDWVIDDSVFTNCTAQSQGGGVRAASGAVGAVTNTAFVTCGGKSSGPALYSDATVTMFKCRVVDSRELQANTVWGAIRVDANSLIDSCFFSRNQGHYGTAGNIGQRSVVTNCVFENQRRSFAYADRGVFTRAGSVGRYTIRNCLFRNVESNSVVDENGDVENCTFTNLCIAYMCGRSQNSFRNCLFTGSTNVTRVGNCKFDNCSFVANFGGPALGANSHSPTFTNCVFWANTPYTKDNFRGNMGLLVQSKDFAATNRIAMANCVFQSDRETSTEAPDMRDADKTGASAVLTEKAIAAGQELFVAPGMGDWHLRKNSPLVDGGLVLGWMTEDATDLDGKPRVVGMAPDVGCFERQGDEIDPPYPCTRVVAKEEDRTGVWTNAVVGLKEALAVARENEPVYMKAGTYDVTEPVTVRGWRVCVIGEGTDKTIVDGGFPARTNRIFTIDEDNVTLSGLTIRNGRMKGTNQNGGGVYVNANGFTITNCVIDTCGAYDGGGLYWAKDKSVGGGILGCVFTNCESDHDGSGLYQYAANGFVRGTTFADCAAVQSGACCINGANWVIVDSVFTNCTGNYGGGVRGYGGAPGVVTGTKFLSCGGKASGIALYSDSAVDFHNCRFVGNRDLNNNSSGVIRTAGINVVDACYFSRNQGGSGVSAFIGEGSVMTNCVVEDQPKSIGNASSGVVKRSTGNGSITVRNSRFLSVSGNTIGDGSVNFENCVFTNVYATDKFGGGQNYVRNCLFVGWTNTVRSGSCRYENCSFVTNVGGAFVTKSWSPTYTNCVFWGNTLNREGKCRGNSGIQIESDDKTPESRIKLANCVLQTLEEDDPDKSKYGDVRLADPTGATTNLTAVVVRRGPKFVDPANGNWRLKQNSPLRDAALTQGWMTDAATDLDGKPRRISSDGKSYPDSLPDIGCYECDIPKPGFLLQVR